MSFEIKASIILVLTIDGMIARLIGKYRPIAKIIAIRYNHLLTIWYNLNKIEI